MSKNSRRTLLGRLWRDYFSRHKTPLIIALTLIAVSKGLELVGPMLIGRTVSAIGGSSPVLKKGADAVLRAGQAHVRFGRGYTTTDFPAVYRYAVMLAVFYIVSAVLSYLLSQVLVRVSQKVIVQMRRDIFDRLGKMPVSFFDTHKPGEIISVVSYNVDKVNEALSADLLQILTSIIVVVGSFVYLTILEPYMLIIFAVTIPLSVMYTRYVVKRVGGLFKTRSAKLAALNGFVEEMVEGQKTVVSYNREEQIIARFDVKNEEAINAYNRSEYYGTMTGPGVNFINTLSMMAVGVVGAIFCIKGIRGMNIAKITSLTLYSRKFSGPINEIANVWGEIQSSFGSAEHVFDLIDAPIEQPDKENALALTDIRGDVSIQNIRFGYNKEREIIRGLSLEARSGELVAIVGPTGAGKTTIINLLMRFYDIDEGTILLDGHNIYDLTRGSVRGAYTIVLQDTWLFHGTIYENVAYGNPSATREDVIAACKAAKIHGFIKRLPQGYDTVLTDDAGGISKGQKQLLTIARAMLIDSKMLILDEATSNVDTQTERRIQDAMYALMRGKTCFVIAHRLSTIKNADKIVVMRDGEAVEVGTTATGANGEIIPAHESLLAARGAYYKMYNSQFEG